MQLDSIQLLYKDLDDLIAQLEFLRGNPTIGRMTEIKLRKDYKAIWAEEEENEI